jgi:dihydroorotate dehydrogenase
MPDWSYHPLFKPWLSRLPGNGGREFIHRGMSSISRLPGGSRFIEFLGHMAPSERLSKSLFGLHFSSPVGLSGKIDPCLTGIDAFPHLGFGFIEIGPVTISPSRPDQAAFISNVDHALISSSAIETAGLDKTVSKLDRVRESGVPLMIRIGDLNTVPDRMKGYGDLFVADIDLIHSIEELTFLINTLGGKPVLLAIKHGQAAREMTKILEYSKMASGIIVDEESIPSQNQQKTPLRQTEGMLHAISLLKNETNLPILTSGGVVEPADALALFSAGAELILLSGGYVASGPGLPKRIHEALLDNQYPDRREISGWIWYWLFGLFILLGGAIVLFFSFTQVILFYDEAFLNMSRLELLAFNPNLYQFMSHDRMTLAGTMISGGFVYMQLARHGVRYGTHWTRKAFNIAAIIGFLGILLFLGFGYFDWLHGLFWLILLPIFIKGFIETKNAAEAPASRNRTNHKSWKRAIYAQLCFVLLGSAFVAGGIVISTIGATFVFVDTDLQYICMTPGQLNELNEKLIPVIAHDRAGFGSALLSVGLLVLMLSLWGFQEGASWVWQTYLFGGIPAFATGIFTHLYIGYTDFIHLLPAYFALVLYLIGLWLSKDYFKKPDSRM